MSTSLRICVNYEQAGTAACLYQEITGILYDQQEIHEICTNVVV